MLTLTNHMLITIMLYIDLYDIKHMIQIILSYRKEVLYGKDADWAGTSLAEQYDPALF